MFKNDMEFIRWQLKTAKIKNNYSAAYVGGAALEADDEDWLDLAKGFAILCEYENKRKFNGISSESEFWIDWIECSERSISNGF